MRKSRALDREKKVRHLCVLQVELVQIRTGVKGFDRPMDVCPIKQADLQVHARFEAVNGSAHVL